MQIRGPMIRNLLSYDITRLTNFRPTLKGTFLTSSIIIIWSNMNQMYFNCIFVMPISTHSAINWLFHVKRLSIAIFVIKLEASIDSTCKPTQANAAIANSTAYTNNNKWTLFSFFLYFSPIFIVRGNGVFCCGKWCSNEFLWLFFHNFYWDGT